MAARLVLVLLLVPTDALIQSRRRLAPSKTKVRMGWGAEPTWGACEVVSNDPAATGLRAITLSVPGEKASQHAKGGQFVQVKPQGDSKPGFYAIASAPGASPSSFEFLIKEAEANEWITGAKPGDALEMSDVAGNGFGCEEHFSADATKATAYDGFATSNLLLICAGSGIAPIRSTIESGAAVEMPEPATLLFGVRDADHTPYRDKFDSWQKDFNVNVVPVHSRPQAGWTGQTGYVQDALKRAGVQVPRNTGAALCGPKDMFVACKDILLDAGVFEGRVRANF